MARKKLWKQLIAAMLAISMLVTSVELTINAASADSITDAEVAESEEATEESLEEEILSEEEEAKILSEVEEEREEDSKTFLMDDGTFMVAQYGAPIHYEDAQGQWEEIDYTLQEEASDGEDVYTTTKKAGLRDRIKFSKKLKEGKTVSIKNTEFPLSWGIKDAEKATVQVEEAENGETKNWKQCRKMSVRSVWKMTGRPSTRSVPRT